MITTLTGANTFSLQNELDVLTHSFLDTYGDIAIERLDGEEVEYEQLQAALTSLPFLADKKLVVLRRPSANKQFIENAERLLAESSSKTDVIIVEPKLDSRLKYYKFLKKSTDYREFLELDAAGLVRWLVGAATAQGGKLAPVDARYLIERVGLGQQMLHNEVDKLILYDPQITRSTIDTLTEASPQSTIFQLLEAAFSGNAKAVLKIYKEQRALKVEPPQIIAMLTWQLHILAVIKSAGDRTTEEIAKEARLNPFVVRKNQTIIRTLTIERLKKLLADLLVIDTRSKRQNIDIDEALQYYLLAL
jgi:DNA polymerase-3 subunit delta